MHTLRSGYVFPLCMSTSPVTSVDCNAAGIHSVTKRGVSGGYCNQINSLPQSNMLRCYLLNVYKIPS
jgi:hypothetical protein